jgi:thioredoxin 1
MKDKTTYKALLAALFILLIIPLAACAQGKDKSDPLLHLDDTNFEKSVAGKVVIVDFYADWCGPCRAFSPTYIKVAKARPDSVFIKLDVDASPRMSQKYRIEFIPYVVVMKDGVVKEQYEGSRTEADFTAWADAVTKKYK